MSEPARVYLLSPARLDGKRAALLMRPEASFELAVRLRTSGLPIGEVFTFISGLYFRGKLAYAERNASPPPRTGGALVITTDRGLVRADRRVTLEDLAAMSRVPIDLDEPRYREPLLRDALELAHALGGGTAVLLGSLATGKYADVLREGLGTSLCVPREFAGRGDMSRGGLMLRCVRAGERLTYVPLADAPRHGPRPPKLSAPAPRVRAFEHASA